MEISIPNNSVPPPITESIMEEQKSLYDEHELQNPILEDGLSFPSLIHGDSVFRSMDFQLPLLHGNSTFSNFGQDDGIQNNGLSLSRQASITGRPLTLQQDGRNSIFSLKSDES